jgi:SAM-dependent methyltransferase
VSFERDRALWRTLRTERNGVRAVDLGCGRGKLEGAVGVDCRPHADVNVLADLDFFPWPFADNAFDLILFNNIIEHVADVVRCMEEVHRIARPGAQVVIRTPHFSHPESYRDPTHRRHLSWESLEYFLMEDPKHGLYTTARFRLITRELVFGSGVWGRVGRALAAISPRRYEKYYCHGIPCNGLYFRLAVVKDG